jgi:cell division transport system permease protein
VAATGIMSLSLVLFLGLLATQFITNKVVVSLQEKVDISAYFKTDATEEDIMKMKSDLSARADIKSVDYTSREQALEEFKKRHEGDPLIQESLAQLDENPLAASLNIKTQNIGQYASIVSFLEGSKFKEFIDKINFYENQTVIERIEKLSMSLKTWGLTAIALIALIAALVTFNTVRLTIYNQKREIEIMRLVGASNWHIRGPYLVEGGFYGLFAALIALAVFYPIVYAVSDKITYFTEAVDLQKYFVGGVIQIVPLTVLLGMTLGTLSSLIAIRKHLKN